MSPQTTKLLQDRLAILPQEIIGLVQSNQINETVLKIQRDFSLSEAQANLLSNEIILTVLFFCEVATLPQRLEEELGINMETAEQMNSIITEFIFKKYQGFYAAANTTLSAAGLQTPSATAPSIPIPPPAAPGPEKNELYADIAETEAALQAVPAIRTMADDVARSQQAQPENTYTSSQEALLKESAHTLPKDESRWGNQT